MPFSSPTKSCLRSPLKAPLVSSGNVGSPSKTVSFPSSSPESSSSEQELLSSTAWSRNHWLLLDSIIQKWKPEHQSEGELSDGSGSGKKRRNSTRVISKLLGRKVFAQGEERTFEQWHLEAVDAFRHQVPGWPEKVVAMRVFALLLGEEKRALGLVQKSSMDFTNRNETPVRA